MRLSPTTQDMTTIATEFGIFRYNRILMSICTSRYILQAKVDKILGDIEGAKTYIDDILVLIKDCFMNHIEQLRIIFRRFCASGLKANATKCGFGLKEISQLGHLIKREGIKTDTRKLKGNMDLGQPTTTTEAQSLIGMVQYYKYMLPRRSHILCPLIEAAVGSRGRNILWNDALESSFKELKYMVSVEMPLHYPDWAIPVTVHTDASDKQLCVVISQNKKLNDFSSRRLIKQLCNYTMTEKGLLAIVKFLKQPRRIIFGNEINKNLHIIKIWSMPQP